MVEFPLRRLTSPTTAAFVAARSRVWYIRLRLGWGGPVGGVDLFIIRRNPGWLGGLEWSLCSVGCVHAHSTTRHKRAVQI